MKFLIVLMSLLVITGGIVSFSQAIPMVNDQSMDSMIINETTGSPCSAKKINDHEILSISNIKIDATLYYPDEDRDSYGDSTAPGSEEYIDGWVDNNLDCNDANESVNPDAVEIIDEIDNDCDGEIDEPNTWYKDSDQDGYGNPEELVSEIEAPDGYVADGSDCDDDDPDVYPGAPELLDEKDNDCDGQVDEDLIWYWDGDNDGYGTYDSFVYSEEQPDGFVDNASDCDDDNADVYPGAPEIEDGLDNDCNDLVDDGIEYTWYLDLDNDTYGNSSVWVNSTDQPAGYVSRGGDCDDSYSGTNPGSYEIPDGEDNDCDGIIDEDIVHNYWYFDGDGDGYGNDSVFLDYWVNPNGPIIVYLPPPEDFITQGGDCDDSDANTNPGAYEILDQKDNDCDGIVDEDIVHNYLYWDDDGDGFGNSSRVLDLWYNPNGPPMHYVQPAEEYVLVDGDCDDSNADVYPGAIELADGLDNDCDGLIDNGVVTPTSQTTEVDNSTTLTETPDEQPTSISLPYTGFISSFIVAIPLIIRIRLREKIFVSER